ncbi:NaeI family type II restriction endonuclease [Nocardia cyriacigeorgica]|uniref:NaeI family type II restriction endonuclease n=1 Tax=Nocardia cyriacigeorgica TaxID=135487 RepID=UPI0024542B5A|nr:NaeI family type II restriction endonuclease [Nocardia cyriacigeorgica]
MKRAGRPRSPGRGQSEEVNALAALVQDQLAIAGMSGRQLHRALQASGYADMHPLPSHATLQRRINGEHLANYGHLVDAIIEICTPPAQVASVRARAKELQRRAWRAPTPVPTNHGPTDVDQLRAQVDRLSHLYEMQLQLTRENLNRPVDQQGSAHNAAALIWLLAAVGSRSNGGRPLRDDGLEERLRSVERERDDARRALANAQLRVRRLEERLAPVPVTEPGAGQVTVPRADPELSALIAELLRLDPAGSRLANAVRRAMNSVLDGARTGRYSLEQLTKTEKAMLGTQVKFEVQREFKLKSARTVDFALGGTEFALRFSTVRQNWSFPRESDGRIALCVTANEKSSLWSAGLIRVELQLLSGGMNQDGKRTLNREGRDAIQWLHRDQPLPDNVLTQLSAFDIDAIFSAATGRQRVTELLRRAQGRLISNNDVATVAMQDDAMRRVREVRPKLAEEGILVLSGNSSEGVETARRLGIPVPSPGELVTTSRSPSSSRGFPLEKDVDDV